MRRLFDLTPIRQGFLCTLKTTEGNPPAAILEVLKPHLSPIFTKNGIKWHLVSLSFFKNFVNHTVIQRFLKVGHRSNSSDNPKFSAFRRTKNLKIYNLLPIWTIHTSNESWNPCKLIFGIEKYCLIKKICCFQNLLFNFYERIFNRQRYVHKVLWL